MIDTERGIIPQHVPQGVSLVTPAHNTNEQISESSPALSVMTDLRLITPFQICSSSSIDAANEKMIACGVRLLFVHDTHENLLGLITSKDVLGEKPLQFVVANSCAHDDVTVKDIMTPISKLEALPLAQIETATVGDIVSALRDCRRHHMLVLQQQDKCSCIRGIISLTQVGRLLGTEMTPSVRAQNFAQLNKALG